MSQRVLLEWKHQGGALGGRAHVGLKYMLRNLDFILRALGEHGRFVREGEA